MASSSVLPEAQPFESAAQKALSSPSEATFGSA